MLAFLGMLLGLQQILNNEPPDVYYKPQKYLKEEVLLLF
jgi:hypothetical protein